MKFIKDNLDNFSFTNEPGDSYYLYIFDINFAKGTYKFDIIHNVNHYTNHNIIHSQENDSTYIANYQAIIGNAHHFENVEANDIEQFALNFQEDLERLREKYYNCEITRRDLYDFEVHLRCVPLGKPDPDENDFQEMLNDLVHYVLLDNIILYEMGREDLKTFEEVKEYIINEIYIVFDSNAEMTGFSKNKINKIREELETTHKDEINEIIKILMEDLEAYAEDLEDYAEIAKGYEEYVKNEENEKKEVISNTLSM